MAVYREDTDLRFLGRCENEELDLLVSLITHDPRDNTLRWTETLSGSDNYKRFWPAHRNYWQEIAAEIQTFGASSIASVFRGGKGILYREVLCDVCDHTGVKYTKEETTEAIELSLLMGLLEKSLNEMSAEELREFADSMGTELTAPTAPLILMAIQTAVRASGFAAYRLSVVMLSTLAKVVLGRALPMVTYLTLTRSIGVLAGPVGIALSTSWLIADMTGPAWRVTVPACLLVACLRQQYLHHSQ
ncbi:DUF3944 domain-containing protein [Enterobacter ludwigii]|jgi:uncharacterized protein YaaW (UPF0174 family)|uniref:DUF3944 domain-containing protein n=1 Tax=Enterobacter ludwigii TaxID=299767 RepID=UPI00159BF351|nr:DUF3944 domain-containing protein [Enterobacter ludwigii]MEA3941134.1 DUF3944 domain-containing protein [Enterobacter ludwigii]QLA07569.1 DUF3944 domain-containing protein [Enterobacter ludwigii]